MRDYGIEPVIWDGDKDCEHEWGSKSITLKHKSGETNPGKESWFKDRGASDDKGNCFCLKCGAWKGSLGLEPTFELYIKHLCDIFDEIKRVLRKDGTCFVNIGDSYGGSGNASGHKEDTKNLGYKTLEMGATQGNQKTTGQYAKSLLDIPYRFSIEMTNRGWIKRNTIIWKKPNCMPASANDRFTVDYEYLFFFTKNNKAIFWTNEKTLECVSKKPSGTKGIEGKDWEWRKTGTVDRNSPNQRVRDIKKGTLERATEEEIKNYGKGKWKKISLWTGHDYWFEQQFEPILTDSIKRELRGNRPNKYSKDKHLPKGVHPNTMSHVREYRGYDNLEKEISNRIGRNKRAVWTIPTQPFSKAHFAVYPEGLIEIPIKAGCPEFVCKKCGKARLKIYEKGELISSCDYLPMAKKKQIGLNKNHEKDPYGALPKRELKEIGYTDCGCNTGFESGIVLDPFMGAGTTALVALKQRKRFIGIEIKQEYIDMAKKRIANVQQKIF